MWQLDILPTAQSVDSEQISNSTACVIDVLRATSVITTALANGATQVVAVATTDEALQYRRQNASGVLLGGERNADKIDGFDLDNSPLRYTPEVVAGKTIVLTTTNGTLALSKCRRCRQTLVASLLNTSATIEYLSQQSCDITIVCAGTEGRFSLEDALCAGMIADALRHRFRLTDFALAMAQMYNSACAELKHFASQGFHYQRLVQKGYAADIDFCFDTSKQLPVVVCEGETCRLG